jgi:hypothetical protein
MFSADIWAVLFLLHYQPEQTDRSAKTSWEIQVAVTGDSDGPPTAPPRETIQIWMKNGSVGYWPNVEKPVPLDAIRGQVMMEQEQTGNRPTIRLLSDPGLSLRDWAPVIEALGPHSRSLSVTLMPNEQR